MEIRFSDGAQYDRLMGDWSRAVGSLFLDWLRPEAGSSWLDVGCGSGAFSSLVVERCAPLSLLGVDPSDDQLAFARARGIGALASFQHGDAMRIDLSDQSVDVARPHWCFISCPILPVVSGRWREWFAAVELSRPMSGILRPAGFPTRQCIVRRSSAILSCRRHRIRRPATPKCWNAFGPRRVWRKSKGDRFALREDFATSTTTGRQHSCRRVSKPLPKACPRSGCLASRKLPADTCQIPERSVPAQTPSRALSERSSLESGHHASQ